MPKYTGLFNTIATIAREEGPLALWKGISAGIQRQVVFAGIRIGTYPYVLTILI